MLMPQRSLDATETNAGINASNPSIAAGQRSAHRLNLWNWLREDASELCNLLSEAEQTCCGRTACISIGTAQSKTSASTEGESHEIDLNAADWGGLEEFFPELQHPNRRHASMEGH
ncbi:hypothetical protein CERZMDRAFT_92417 [Cercospora zeae-maydis SCOH1-5]|uniref:Uncharacterized protein n=1 Tax=Cercospora zeae-maydis SCOH1-5 TaxID=717836 RepID=A0A6A6FWK5_9PEZI|nr:hypothetical protein CERZMDRAFT_92417 [Cercospora zeae-maydis SCOH1-5]